MTIRFDGRVAIITGSGGGLGRCHALGLAARGAKVVVNDIGKDGAASESALKVVGEIRAAGGVAMADGADVVNLEQITAMVARAEKEWGRVDILVNNAGILRDKSFAKMEMSDFDRVVRVHLTGSANCSKAVWNGMRERNYGRIVFTSSASGIYGNFGQANYGAAKAAMIEMRDSRQHARPDRGDRHDGRLADARRRCAAFARIRDAGCAVPRQRRRALAGHPRRRRRRLRRDAHRGDARRLSRRNGAVARLDRGALGRNLPSGVIPAR